MRVVGGRWRGRPLNAPDGRGTRPTTDRMRESIASMVLSACGLDLSDASVLDAFAGSGGMGIELLSRGAAWCTFCEKDRRAAGVVRKNCQGVAGQERCWQVVVGDVTRMGSAGRLPGAPFSILFLDPPYALGANAVEALVQSLRDSGQLTADCLVAYEHAADAPGLRLLGASELKSRRHGGTCVDLIRLEDE